MSKLDLQQCLNKMCSFQTKDWSYIDYPVPLNIQIDTESTTENTLTSQKYHIQPYFKTKSDMRRVH